MRPVLFVAALAMVALVAVWAYRVNYDTRAAVERVETLQRQIHREREAIAVLRAEWAWLNRPERLAGLVAQHAEALGLEPLRPTQMAEIGPLVRMPPPPAPPGPPPRAPWDLPVVDALPVRLAGLTAVEHLARHRDAPPPEPAAVDDAPEPHDAPEDAAGPPEPPREVALAALSAPMPLPLPRPPAP